MTMRVPRPPHFNFSRREAGLMILSGLALAGCGANGVGASVRTFVGHPMTVGVASIDVINAYTSPSAPPHIDHLLERSPADRMRRWAETRLIAGGERGNLMVTIGKASLTEEALDTSSGVKALLTDEQSRLVRVELEAAFAFSHPEGRRSVTMNVGAVYERSIAESATVAEADRVRDIVVEEGLGSFDREFRQRIEAATASGWPLVGR